MSEIQRIGAVALLTTALLGCQIEDSRSENEASVGSPESHEAMRLLEESRDFFQIQPNPGLPAVFWEHGFIEEPSVESPLAGSTGATLVETDGFFSALFSKPSSREMAVLIPTVLDQGFKLEDGPSGVAIRSRLVGAGAIGGEIADGHVIYPAALRGATVIHRPLSSGLEDFVVIHSRPELERLEYEVDLQGATAGLRLVSDTLEFLDDEGAPRLRIAPPYVVDAEGRMVWASLTVSGCEVDRSPVAPWGRPVVDPRAYTCNVEVDWSGNDLTYPLLVDPNWTSTLNMVTARESHTSTVFSFAGKVRRHCRRRFRLVRYLVCYRRALQRHIGALVDGRDHGHRTRPPFIHFPLGLWSLWTRGGRVQFVRRAPLR
jgi:hypothetical protein